VASVVTTTCQSGCYSLSTMLSLLQANFIHQTYIAGLVKHLSLYTGCISEWISFALSPFAHKKKRITACCSLQDHFNSNVTIFNVYKWCHSGVIVIKHSWYSELNSLQNMIFRIWKTNRMTLFRSLFIARPSLIHTNNWRPTIQLHTTTIFTCHQRLHITEETIKPSQLLDKLIPKHAFH